MRINRAYSLRYGLAVLWAMALVPCYASFWYEPEPFTVESDNGRYRATLEPSVTTTTQSWWPLAPVTTTILRPGQLTVFAADELGTRVLWTATLSNKHIPCDAFIADDGRHVVTRDNYFVGAEGDDVLAFYTPQGQTAKYSIAEIFPQQSEYRTQFGMQKPLSDTFGNPDHDLWALGSITFIDHALPTPAFCMWLGPFKRWMAWDMATGQRIEADDRLLKSWNERGRKFAAECFADESRNNPGFDYPCMGPILLLSHLKQPIDREILESGLHAPFNFKEFPQNGGSFLESNIRRRIDEALAKWDGFISRTEYYPLCITNHDYLFLGNISGHFTFPAGFREKVTLHLVPKESSKGDDVYFDHLIEDAKASSGPMMLGFRGVQSGEYHVSAASETAKITSPFFTVKAQEFVALNFDFTSGAASIAFKLTAEMLANERFLAEGRNIDELQRLFEAYGGSPEDWMKKSTLPFESEGVLVEIHWYEHPDIGKVEMKLKKVNE